MAVEDADRSGRRRACLAAFVAVRETVEPVERAVYLSLAKSGAGELGPENIAVGLGLIRPRTYGVAVGLRF